MPVSPKAGTCDANAIQYGIHLLQDIAKSRKGRVKDEHLNEASDLYREDKVG